MPAKQATVCSLGLGSQEDHSDSTHAYASETSPLLSHGNVVHEDDGNGKQESSRLSHRLIVIAMMLTLLVMSCGDKLVESPQQRIMESIVCYKYYEKVDPSKLLASRETVGAGAIGGVPEMLCKVDPVQDTLAKLNGYQQLFDGLPSLLLALPFGWAADHFGRRPIVLMGLVAFGVRQVVIDVVLWYWQVFDIKFVWLSAATGIMGGGEIAVAGILVVVMSDVTHVDERATLFLQMVAANLGAGLVMPIAAAWLMRINPWIPTLCGTILMIAATTIYLPVPETLNYANCASLDLMTMPEINDAAYGTGEISSNAGLPIGKLWLGRFKSARAVFTRDWRVPALILTYTAHYLCAAVTPLLMQYISRRYSVSFSEATLIVTVRAAVNVVLLLVILPGLSHVITVRWRLTPQRKDLILSRVSAVFWCLGYFLIGFAPNIAGIVVALAIGSLGVGVSMLIRAFLTSLVPSNQVARVYACISIVDTVGVMIYSPLLAWLFEVGLGIGDKWVGLPFHALGLITTGIVAVTFMVGLEKGEDEEVTT
ncbi:MFS general substrate transporter [Polychaeton citri CBS 116435]|uniref:MFS general substrate transporter n=1 Tax=Polychaeton citri CBS 116435 TaxID=1314669 RepID=A0A9P4QFY6_9PEZI|nr:MFS general substrate transporter [Polychaeton citri CBS 116435]